MSSSEIQGELWGRAPTDWMDLQESFSVPLWQSMLDTVGVGAGTTFLDAGCGAGGASVLARHRGASVTGLDASDALLALARTRVPDGVFRVGDLEALPFNDGGFEAVIAASSIQYATHPLIALQELARVASSDGMISVGLFSSPEKVEYRVVFKAIADALSEPLQGEGAFALSHPGTLERLIEAAGMRVIDAREIDCPFTFSDMKAFWKGCISVGPVQAALEVVAAEELRTRLEDAAAPYQQKHGSIRFEVAFRQVTAKGR